jgi:hypothetical protein
MDVSRRNTSAKDACTVDYVAKENRKSQAKFKYCNGHSKRMSAIMWQGALKACGEIGVSRFHEAEPT